MASVEITKSEIVLVRHGAIAGAGNYVYYGATDYPLSELGRQQAKEAGARLRGEAFDAIVVSPLSRAVETADILCREAGIDSAGIRSDERLKEMNFGAYEGYGYDRLRAERPDLAQRMETDWLNCAFDGGESPLQFHERVRAFFSELTGHPCRRVLIVAHGGTIRAGGAALLGQPHEFFWRLKSDHCRISRVEIVDGYGMIRCWNA